ncbi:hypothetical protein ACWFRM_20790, partial [Streptomyces sp. NPDC055144]
MIPTRTRATAAAVAALSLALVACGSRVDHDTVVRSVGGGGQVATGPAGADTTVGADGSADAPSGDAAAGVAASGSGAGPRGGGGSGGAASGR